MSISMPMVPNATTVQEKITQAFITAPFPADGYDIYAAQTDDDYGNPIFTTEHLPGRKWFELENEQLNDCYTALTYLRPDGWRHFLPAWLMRELITPYEGLHTILFALRAPTNDSHPWQTKRHDALDPEQTKAVVAYLEHYQQRERNIHATHAHHRYATAGMEWTPEQEPWQWEQETAKMLEYWRGRL